MQKLIQVCSRSPDSEKFYRRYGAEIVMLSHRSYYDSDSDGSPVESDDDAEGKKTPVKRTPVKRKKTPVKKTPVKRTPVKRKKTPVKRKKTPGKKKKKDVATTKVEPKSVDPRTVKITALISPKLSVRKSRRTPSALKKSLDVSLFAVCRQVIY